MATRPFWKGHLKLSLVTCPVALMPAISDAAKIRFHTLSRASGERVESRYVDAVSGKPVAEADALRGFERDDGTYVLLEDAELAGIQIESTHTIDIGSFVPADSIAWIWYYVPYYLVPDDPVGEEAYAVIRDAMAATGMAGVSRLVLHRRERAVILLPRAQGIVVWTLRYGSEVRPETPYFAHIPPQRPAPRLLGMVRKLIAERTTAWDPALAADPVQARLEALIAEKRKKKGGRAAPPKAPPPTEGKVVDIMEALRRSLAEGRRS
jgi:DNA end-binding protein Ku